MPTSAFDIGDKRHLQAIFRDRDGTPTDPTDVFFHLTEPDGSTTIYEFGPDAEVVKSATGTFYVDWTITEQGRHFGMWIGEGDVHTAEGFEFYVRRSNIVPVIPVVATVLVTLASLVASGAGVQA